MINWLFFFNLALDEIEALLVAKTYIVHADLREPFSAFFLYGLEGCLGRPIWRKSEAERLSVWRLWKEPAIKMPKIRAANFIINDFL